MSTPSFKYGNGVWATKEGSSLAYNDDNGHYKPLPFSVSRASSATRVNKQGLIEVVGNDRLRIDYSESAKGVALLEPSRTNLVPYSEDTTGYSHYNYGGGLIVDTYGYPSPDGGNNASRLVYTNSSAGSGGALLTQNITLNATGTYTLSLWIKSISGTNKIRVSPKNTGSQGPSGEVFTITNEWQRYTHTFTNDGGTSRGLQFRISETEDSGDRTFDVWGMQMEEGSYATSYIPTSGSTATRQADVANGAGVANVFNDSEGVLFADIAALADDGTKRRITINNGSSSQFVQLEYRPTNNTIQVGVYNGTSQGYYTESINNSTLHNKIAYSYKANEFKLYVGGFQLGNTITTGTTFSSGVLNKLSFDNGAGGDDFYGKAKAINVYQTALTDAELEYLTSYRSLAEMVTELNLNAL